MKPRLIVLAGPNGAGKSTFFATHLADKQLPFVNADRIAAELGIGASEAAGLAEATRTRLVANRSSFITETVFSDPVGAKLAFLLEACDAGYEVTMFFIGAESPDLLLGRVRARVMRGGHDVPSDKVIARYARTMTNLEKAIRQLPRVIIYDNSSYEDPYCFLAEFRGGVIHERTAGPIPAWVRRFVA